MSDILNSDQIDQLLGAISDEMPPFNPNGQFDDNTLIYDFNLQSTNSKEFQNLIKNKFSNFFKYFSNSFYKLTGNKIELEDFYVEEYESPAGLTNRIFNEGNDFYLRRMIFEDKQLKQNELIEYISPDFVNKILLDSEKKDNDSFISKTLANHFISRIIEHYFANTSKTPISSEDYKLKSPSHIPYIDPIISKSPIINNVIRLENFNTIAINFKINSNDNSGDFFIAGTKSAWLKYFGEKQKPEIIFSNDDFKNHNVFGVFTSFNLSENKIKNLNEGDEFITDNYETFSHIPLIGNNKIIAMGDIILDKNDTTSIQITKPFSNKDQKDYFENNPNNIFILLGSASLENNKLNNPESLDKISFQTKITNSLPILYKNNIIGQALVENSGGYPLIKIEQVYDNPISFI